MNTQDAVNAIRDGMKEEWCMTIWYRSNKGREIKRSYSEAMVLATMREKHEPDAIPIASIIKPIIVGTTQQKSYDLVGHWPE
jgi:hypothetical protein